MKELTIVVEGKINSGKSAIASMLYTILTANGLDVQIDDPDADGMFEHDHAAWIEKQDKRLLALEQQGLKIKVTTRQLPREPAAVLKMS